MNIFNALLSGVTFAFFSTNLWAQYETKDNRKNILFIICDDLRPELGCYGQQQIKSPNIDRWASESVIFNRAYCNIAVSGASRASLLTGLRPTKNLLQAWNARTDVDAPDAVTLQQCFSEAGYITISNGKIYHHQDESSMKYWSDIFPVNSNSGLLYHSEENRELMRKQKEMKTSKRGYFYEYGDFPEEDYVDYQIADKSINDLKILKKSKKPFLLSVGFIRPHLPFIVPQKYWDMYDHSTIKIPDNYILKSGNNIPSKALTNWSELRAYTGIPDSGPLDEETAKMMIHGYYASVSFVDAQIGRVLEALKEEGLDKNTTVILIGDHGWNLGEHGTWCKHSIMNTSLHSTMIINSSEIEKPYISEQIVEFIDLYPTMCEAAGINKPKTLEGSSLIPLLKSQKNKTKGYAVARWDNGFTLIDDNFFYTEWRDKNETLIARMLFNHYEDINENYNVAGEHKYNSVVKNLSKKLIKNRGLNYYK